MNRPTKAQFKAWLGAAQPVEDLRAAIQASPTTPSLLELMRREVPDLGTLPPLTYTQYRIFEHTGSRDEYQVPYFVRRGQLTRAVFEFLAGDLRALDAIHDRLWAICEETTWVLPAHEEQGPDYWEINPPFVRTWPLGAHTMLTREPDSIDLFCAETGAALAETVYLLGDRLAPEVRQRVRQEVQRRIFKPYLAYGRKHWWFKGALNWNGVCNGSIGLAFLRLEDDLETKAEALELVLEGFEAYIATGFEADGGSIEGMGYWNYGLMYYITVAELLRELTGGALDLLAQPQLKAIAAYPACMALVPPSRFANFGDATETVYLSSGVVNRLAQRTGERSLLALLEPIAQRSPSGDLRLLPVQFGGYSYAKLPILARHAAWWDGTQPAPSLEQRDCFLPDTDVIKLVGETAEGRPVLLVAVGGHNDGHHSHTDVGSFILNVAGESLIPDPGRGLYSKDYFRQGRYANLFNNSYSHSVPRIGGQLQAPGPEFGGRKQFHGRIVEQDARGVTKSAVIEFARAYDLPALTSARRTLELDAATGTVTLTDVFAFDGPPLSIEEAFVTWDTVTVVGDTAQIVGARTQLDLTILEPAGARFSTESLAEACRANHRDGVLTRLAVALPAGATQFRLRMSPR